MLRIGKSEGILLLFFLEGHLTFKGKRVFLCHIIILPINWTGV